MPVSQTHSLSIVIMTYNEEANIARCLDSISAIGDEIFILDSFSTDSTLAIAGKYATRIEQHPFDTYAHQRQRTIDKAKNDWVLVMDADEYLSTELRASIIEAKKDLRHDGYSFNRKNKIGEKWISHGSWYPDRKIRLFDRRKIKIVGMDPHDVIQPIQGATIGFLKGDLMHLADEDMTSRYQTIDRHSTRAAEALYAKGHQWALWKILIKPCVRFIVSYFFRLGFLDGNYGWFIAQSEAQYVRMREVKLWELWKKLKA